MFVCYVLDHSSGWFCTTAAPTKYRVANELCSIFMVAVYGILHTYTILILSSALAVLLFFVKYGNNTINWYSYNFPADLMLLSGKTSISIFMLKIPRRLNLYLSS
jgi:hypothetical protein